MLCFAVPASESFAALILKGGHTGTPKNYMHITLVRWSDLVKERTKGEVIIEVYPSEQLGNERTLLENANLGTIEWCVVGSGGAVRFVPAFGMFENAYTFQDLKHFEHVAFNRPFMQKMSDLLEQKSNMVMGGFQWLGNRSLLSKNPVKSPEDAKGLKLRVPDVPTYRVVAQALGAIPSPLPFGETYMALKQGVVGDMLINLVKSYSVTPTGLVFALVILVLILGCFVEVTAMFFLVLPVVIPLIEAMGISKVFFGVVFTITAVLGILTPPFGLGLFMITGMTGVPFDRVVKAVIPFLIPLIMTIILLVLFPDLVTFLPNRLIR